MIRIFFLLLLSNAVYILIFAVKFIYEIRGIIFSINFFIHFMWW